MRGKNDMTGRILYETMSYYLCARNAHDSERTRITCYRPPQGAKNI